MTKLSRRRTLEFSLVSGALAAAGCKDDAESETGNGTGSSGGSGTGGSGAGGTADGTSGSTGLGGSGAVVTPDVEVIVIGTGFGGAVAALRLGQAGVTTLMIERGRRWPVTDSFDTFSPTFPADNRSTWLNTQTQLPFGPSLPLTPYTGVLERIETPTIGVYAGAGVGGSSLVYGGLTLQPSQEHFEQVFPADIAYAQLDEIYYPRVASQLAATITPADILAMDHLRYAQVFDAQAKAAGLTLRTPLQAADWDIVRAEAAGELPPSAIVGDLIFGANTGWKNSLDRNYLPAAEATGFVAIQELHQVTGIARDGELWEVQMDRIDETGQVLESLSMTCGALFMAAGSMVTPRLLLEARERGVLPELHASVGQGWGSNGDTMFLRSEIGAETGEQGGPPVTAIVHADNAVAPVLLESAQLSVGGECGCLLSLALSIDESRGAFEYDAQQDRASLAWPENGNEQAVAAVGETIDRLNNANGGQVTDNLLGTVLSDFTYHPLGGMVLGDSCDFYGRVKGYANLYVIDGSMLPGSGALTNPSWTIAALAERNIEEIIAQDFV